MDLVRGKGYDSTIELSTHFAFASIFPTLLDLYDLGEWVESLWPPIDVYQKDFL